MSRTWSAGTGALALAFVWLVALQAWAKPPRAERKPTRCTQARDCPRVAKASGPGQPVDVCEAKQCVVKQLDESPITACERDDQCVVVVPRCCWCDYSEVVAIGKGQEAALHELVCTNDGQGVQCPECARAQRRPQAICKAGRCAVAR